MKDFFDTWKFKILIGIAVFLVGIMAYAGVQIVPVNVVYLGIQMEQYEISEKNT